LDPTPTPLQGDVSTLVDAISTLQASAQTYAGHQAIVPDYQPGTAPPRAGEVDEQVGESQLTVAKARARIRAAHAAAKQSVALAKDYARKADTACSRAGH
jgi:hypothetical protein